VAAISMTFLRINLPNFVQFKQFQGKSGPRRTTRYFVQSKYFSFHYLEYKQY